MFSDTVTKRKQKQIEKEKTEDGSEGATAQYFSSVSVKSQSVTIKFHLCSRNSNHWKTV